MLQKYVFDTATRLQSIEMCQACFSFGGKYDIPYHKNFTKRLVIKNFVVNLLPN